MAKNVSRKKSPIWDYFDLAEDTKYALCKICGKSISRGGGSTKVYNTSNLVNHLKCHSEAYEEYQRKHTEYLEKEKAKKEEGSAKQLSLFVVQDKVKAWDINDSRAQRVHRFVMEMIAMDIQPFSLVEDFGFARLLHLLEPRYHLPSRKYFVEKLLPLVHDEVKTRVNAEIGRVSHFSFTTDAWSSSGGDCLLLSLTAHWLTKEFVRKSAVLHVQPLEGSHTGEYFSSSIQENVKWMGN